MRPIALAVAVALSSACATSGQPSVGDPNNPVNAAVDTLTTAIFNQEQPAVNAVAATLPPEAQTLVQAAYAALEEAIKKAEQAGLKMLVVDAKDRKSVV